MAENQPGKIGTMNGNTFVRVLTLENPMFATYMIVSSLLVLKMSALILLTIFYRFKHKAFISDEDTKLRAGSTTEKNEDVERVRRAFQNDIETIPVFMIIALLYLFVSAPGWLVHSLLYLFLLARVGHSIVYAVYVVPQPARAIMFLIGFAILGYMCFHVAIYALAVGYMGK